MADIKNSAPPLVPSGAIERGINARSAEVSLALEKSVRKGTDEDDGNDGDEDGDDDDDDATMTTTFVRKFFKK